MTIRAVVAGIVAAAVLLGMTGFVPDAHAQQAARAQLNDHMLPVAAGALVGAAAGFFLLPWVIPATAVAAAAGASTTASPMLAAVGAGIGGVLGYELAP